jgi:dihydrofolate reductase
MGAGVPRVRVFFTHADLKFFQSRSDPEIEIARRDLGSSADRKGLYCGMEMLNTSGALIMGRRTYELMAGAWPTDTDNDPRVKGTDL